LFSLITQRNEQSVTNEEEYKAFVYLVKYNLIAYVGFSFINQTSTADIVLPMRSDTIAT